MRWTSVEVEVEVEQGLVLSPFFSVTTTHMTKTCTLCKIQKPLDEFGPKKKAKDGRDCWCRACCRLRATEYRLKNLDTTRAASREASAKNREARKPYYKAWVEKNRDSLNAYKRQYRASNFEAVQASEKKSKTKHRDKQLVYKKNYYQANSDKWLGYARFRLRSIRLATPPWVDLDALQAVYDESSRLSAETGVKHNVDHIIPITNELVCGLHVPWNLRVVEEMVNRVKANKFCIDEHTVFHIQHSTFR